MTVSNNPVNVNDFGGTVNGVGTAPVTATINANDWIVLTPALATAAGAQFTVTVTNANIGPNSIVQVEAMGGGGSTNSTLGLAVNEVTPGNGTVSVNIKNTAAVALNGTVRLGFSIT